MKVPILLLLSLPVFAQSTQPAAPSITPEWDISQTLDALSAQVKRLRPILDQLTPAEWVKRGAPDTYVAQWKGTRDELGYLANSIKVFEKQPERVTLALDTFFRLITLENRLNSFVEGVREYQNPAVGDLMVSVLGEANTNRDNLRQYITDLAATREKEFEIMDKEAQRCRSQMNAPRKAPTTSKPGSPNDE